MVPIYSDSTWSGHTLLHTSHHQAAPSGTKDFLKCILGVPETFESGHRVFLLLPHLIISAGWNYELDQRF